MPEIGATLRETRMRQRIDISDMEVRTKIRAKYLRALENEEWDLLPGPTYVKSFLRTYADALGLDSKRLVEEYKLRHDPLETGDLHPIRPPTQRDRQRRRGGEPSGGLPRWAVVGVVLLLILAALSLIGRNGDDDEPSTAARTQETPPPARNGGDDEEPERPEPKVVRLTVAPTAAVWVCLVNGGGERLIPGTVIEPGRTRTYRAKRFRVTLGNGSVRFRVNGRAFQPPQAAEPQGFEFTLDGRRTLDESDRPTCET